MDEGCNCRFIGCLESVRGWCDRWVRSENRESVCVDIASSPFGQVPDHLRRRAVNVFQSTGSYSKDSLFSAKTIVISHNDRSKVPREMYKGEVVLNVASSRK